MEYTADMFRTPAFKNWKRSNNAVLEKDCFLYKNKTLFCFDLDHVDTYVDRYDMFFYFLSEEEYKLYKAKYNYPHAVYKNKFILLSCDESFFALKGKKYADIRYAINRYGNSIRMSTEIIPQEAIALLETWKRQRRDAHFRLFTGDEKQYLQNYLPENDLITLSFYATVQKTETENALLTSEPAEQLVGYSIVEHIKGDLYNLLFRKVDTSFSQLNYYVDYKTYLHLYKGAPFVINFGDDGDKNMMAYKTKHFNVLTTIPAHILKINKRMKQLPNLGLFEQQDIIKTEPNKITKDHHIIRNLRKEQSSGKDIGDFIKKYEDKAKDNTEEYKKLFWGTKNHMEMQFMLSTHNIQFDCVDSMIDVGCGTGNYFAYLLPRFDIKTVIGLDSSHEFLSIAKEKHIRTDIEYVESSLFDVNVARSFDLVTCNGVLQTLKLSKLDQVMQLLKSMVSKNGQLWLTTINYEIHYAYGKSRRFFGLNSYIPEELIYFLQDEFDVFYNYYGTKGNIEPRATGRFFYIYAKRKSNGI